MSGNLKTVVCGTRFGENYISALLEEDTGFTLHGLLARGSPRSQALAADLGVRLFTNPDELPDDVDVACVVLRSGAFGGPGTEIAKALLQRGIHVLQEHPVHPSEVRQLLRIAEERGVTYQINCFYAHSPAARAFIRFVGEWRSARAPHYVIATTAPQLLYSSLDLLGRAFGGIPDFTIAKAGIPAGAFAREEGAAQPFEILTGHMGTVPLILNLQPYLDPRDPDHHALVMHNIAVGGPEGRIELVNSFGPLVWSRAIYVPDYARDDAGASYLADWAGKAEDRHMSLPTALTIGAPDGPSLAQAGRTVFPQIIFAALSELRQGIEGGDAPPFCQHPDYLLALAEAWRATMRAIGPLTERELPPPPASVPDPRSFAEAMRGASCPRQTHR